MHADDDPGWSLLGRATGPELAALDAELAAAVRDGAPAHGMRDVLVRCPAARMLAQRLRTEAAGRLGSRARLIRGLLLDKTGGANWRVPWHQDLSAGFEQRVDHEGFANWTIKQGVAHADLPEPWASRRTALRVHLDPCPAEAGPLRVLPGTHRAGVLAPAVIADRVASLAPLTLLAERGEVIAMHPLLLHASAPARRPGRRVLHLEYVAADPPLPRGLEWAQRDP